ncbi:MAG: hypothetical protein QF450_12590 [Rhodospirillales bacterium]|nr:hypothetical protein [Rhodospirillales bacterium]
MKATIRILVVLSAVAVGTAPSAAEETLDIIARVGPWPHLSNIAGYGGRLWLVNSVKFRNHNSADVYSYDPATSRVRYEHHAASAKTGRFSGQPGASPTVSPSSTRRRRSDPPSARRPVTKPKTRRPSAASSTMRLTRPSGVGRRKSAFDQIGKGWARAHRRRYSQQHRVPPCWHRQPPALVCETSARMHPYQFIQQV